jgi:hypothetical protein
MTAPPEKRVELMNAFKRQLARMNRRQRAAAVDRLRRQIHGTGNRGSRAMAGRIDGCNGQRQHMGRHRPRGGESGMARPSNGLGAGHGAGRHRKKPSWHSRWSVWNHPPSKHSKMRTSTGWPTGSTSAPIHPSPTLSIRPAVRSNLSHRAPPWLCGWA